MDLVTVFKYKLRRLTYKFVSTQIQFFLKSFGYGKPVTHTNGMPQSHFYIHPKPWDAFAGLHKIPSNKYWLESKRCNQSVKDGESVPWVTYPALSFLEKIDFTDLSCVEFGSGASTFWFAARCRDIKSFEFDIAYYRLLTEIPTLESSILVDSSGLIDYLVKADQALDEYQIYIDRDLDHEYAGKTPSHVDGKIQVENLVIKIRQEIARADCVFIDGGPRNFLISLAAELLKDEALLVIDNTDLDYLELGLAALKSNGFKEIPFVGFGPLNDYEWQTSIFIKSLEPLDFLKSKANNIQGL
jgi:hypothetical protein